MIDQILPLSNNTMNILKYIYENQPTHLRKIATELHLHPYVTKRCIDTLTKNHILEQQQAGRTILLTINTLQDQRGHLLYFIEDYKQKTENKTIKQIIKHLSQQFSKNAGILTCVLFGSYAREAATKNSDVDVLFVITTKSAQTDIIKKITHLGTLMNLKFSPIIMMEDEFRKTLDTHEPTVITLLTPSQRMLIFGLEYFIRTTRP